MKKLMSNVTPRRFAAMLMGIVLLSLGVSVFKISLMGNDPYSAFAMAVGERTRWGFALTLFILNCVCFMLELAFGRRLIGIGTLANWFGVGVLSSGFTRLLSLLPVYPETLPARLGVMLIGVAVFGVACSLYQTADVGIAPYDALSLMLAERLARVPYFWCRMFTDTLCAFVAWRLGGIVGLGTLVSAVGLGPVISFFDIHISRRFCGLDEKNSN